LAGYRHRKALRRTLWAACIGAIALLHAATCVGESLRAKIHKGNALYHEGLYDDALEVYNDAQIDAPESPELHFNIGNVGYRKADHENAIETYRKSFNTDDIGLESRANYNIGNATYRLGEKSGNDVALWRAAMELYRKAIELDPTDKDAKFNLEFVEKKIKDELSKQKEEQEQEQEQQQQEEQQQQDKQQEADDSSEQEREEQASEQEQEVKPEEEEEQQQEQGAEQEEGQQEEKKEDDRSEPAPQTLPVALGQEQAGPVPEDEGLAEQEIFSILQGEEKAAREQAPALMVPYTGRVTKDW
jgi:Ca-activated chloride channel family protein